MSANSDVIERFYKAFQSLDGDAMAACYHDQIRFSDPVFPSLEGERARGMWRMLTARAKDFRLTFSDVKADGDTGSAHWEAHYVFSKTGRKVHNIIDATFRFKDGLIIEHTDSFDLWRWSRMALGPAGTLLGWTPVLRSKVRKTAAQSLDEFMAEKK